MPNRLIHQTSPYLLQHAENPVDWQPWGAEAFAEAKRLDKPLFVSIGYSTCHWCHVMERESFENEDVARVLNKTFVCIKVDREERPDVDDLYMTVCQLLTGRGGWPLNVLLTPDGAPFYALTYLPPDKLAQLAGQVEQAWAGQRRSLVDAGHELLSQVAKLTPEPAAGLPGPDILDQAAQELAQRFDSEQGGFGPAPKFPSAQNLLLLLRHHRRTGDRRSLDMVRSSLEAMRRGGIFDHLGGGFHRYSTDDAWLLPHFEKMLYDQAMLALAYVEGFQALDQGDPSKEPLADTARAVLDYLLRDLAEDQKKPGTGGFHAAEDADSEGEEGRFYVWDADEVRKALGPEDARLFMDAYGFSEDGNFLDEATGLPTSLNIPHLPPGSRHGTPSEEDRQRLAGLRARLLGVREGRVRPHKDDKVLTDWNGLAVAALARAGRVLDEPRYLDAAARTASFLLENHRDGQGLTHVSRHGRTHTRAFLDDYAFLGWGLLELAEAGESSRDWTAEALVLAREMIARFQGPDTGGFHLAQTGDGELPLRRMEGADGAMPSGNSAAVFVLARLALLTGEDGLEQAAKQGVLALGEQLSARPSAFAFLLCGLDLLLGSGALLTLAAPGPEEARPLLRAVDAGYHPEVVLRHEQDETAEARLCRDRACLPPVSSPTELARLLRK